jgi:hypothetical protein
MTFPTNGTGDWHPRPLQQLLDAELTSLEGWLDAAEASDDSTAWWYAERGLARAEALAAELEDAAS